MKFFNGGTVLMSIISLMVLAGCGDGQMEKEEIETVKTEAAEEVTEEKIPRAGRTIEEMVGQKAGVLIEMHMDQQLETLGGWDGQKYLDFLKQTFNPLVEKELETYFSEHADLNGEEVYDYLVHMLGSGNYENYYEQLTAYDHGYIMPELPEGEDEVTTKQKQMNVVVLMDASGSMNGQLGNESKMDLAKAAIEKFAKDIPSDANISLITYGHVGSSSKSDKAASCSTIESMYPLSSYEAEKFTSSLNSFEAKGWTPLAGAIQKAEQQLQDYPAEDYSNLVYMVSDGVETCDGDPVTAAKKLQNQNINAKVNIIGFDVDNEGQQQLKQVADSGGGEYITVKDPAELEVQMTKKWKPSIGQLVWTQGVTIQQFTDAMDRMNKIYNPLYSASDAEQNRIRYAVNFLTNEELITNEVKNEVWELADSLHDLRNDHFRDIKETKEAEREEASEEINAKVEEWRQKWKSE